MNWSRHILGISNCEAKGGRESKREGERKISSGLFSSLFFFLLFFFLSRYECTLIKRSSFSFSISPFLVSQLSNRRNFQKSFFFFFFFFFLSFFSFFLLLSLPRDDGEYEEDDDMPCLVSVGCHILVPVDNCQVLLLLLPSPPLNSSPR